MAPSDDKDESSPLLSSPPRNFNSITPPPPPPSIDPNPLCNTNDPTHNHDGIASPIPETPAPVLKPERLASGGGTPPPPGLKTPTPPPSSVPEAVAKADLEMAWSEPAGLRVRRANDENLVIFRRAVGINSELEHADDCRSLEEGRRKATGMYAATLQAQRHKQMMYTLIQVMVYTSHFMQIIVGASLTALGPTAGEHTITITILGALNTVIAGVLALVKGQGLPERLRQDKAEFRKLQDWIEQTEALLAVGVIGKDRKEVGLLVQIAFVKYNAAKASEENNVPENYVRAIDEADRDPTRPGRQ
ncbi:hypothetical protein QBC34DRAFT_429502 [Podospora aff. communis PSN243]|uniref:SMODS and SLOG-associating 2TM effector domain-containing protein n=1 Tax=Podospora aff. communis PSN243 TaxID=3040156 RepID=A0AAV9G7X9_9PEZI|nr:hypothetical protein QBC34DRAFT_429502 [Podospora aff. communis PSN243]